MLVSVRSTMYLRCTQRRKSACWGMDVGYSFCSIKGQEQEVCMVHNTSEVSKVPERHLAHVIHYI